MYSSKSLYAIMNFRGVQPIFLPAVWHLNMPPKVQGVLWLFSQNKIMTYDNLRKRRLAKPLECVHCSEIESMYHLFFDCLVAKVVWANVMENFNVDIVHFISLASHRLCNKKILHLNVGSSAVLWGLWNTKYAIVYRENLLSRGRTVEYPCGGRCGSLAPLGGQEVAPLSYSVWACSYATDRAVLLQ